MDNMGDMKVISSYSKQDAVDDGCQVLLNSDPKTEKMVKEAGFQVPVYLTSGVAGYVEVPKGLEGLQDTEGRLWDILYLASIKAREMKGSLEMLGAFTVSFQMAANKQVDVEMLIAFNPYEGFTIMLPEDN